MFPRHVRKDKEMCLVQEFSMGRMLVFAAISGGGRQRENPHRGQWMPLDLKAVCFVVLHLKLADALAEVAKSLVRIVPLWMSGLGLEGGKGRSSLQKGLKPWVS